MLFFIWERQQFGYPTTGIPLLYSWRFDGVSRIISGFSRNSEKYIWCLLMYLNNKDMFFLIITASFFKTIVTTLLLNTWWLLLLLINSCYLSVQHLKDVFTIDWKTPFRRLRYEHYNLCDIPDILMSECSRIFKIFPNVPEYSRYLYLLELFTAL